MSKKTSKKPGKSKFEDFDVEKAINELPSSAPAPLATFAAAAAPSTGEAVEFVPIPMEAIESAMPTAPQIQVTVGVGAAGMMPSLMVGGLIPQADNGLVKEPGPPLRKIRVTIDGAPPPAIPGDLMALL